MYSDKDLVKGQIQKVKIWVAKYFSKREILKGITKLMTLITLIKQEISADIRETHLTINSTIVVANLLLVVENRQEIEMMAQEFMVSHTTSME
jgi:hypothetical protein